MDSTETDTTKGAASELTVGLGARPVGYEYRTCYADNTVTPGWCPWERLIPRNQYTETVEDRVREIQAYIETGYKYQLRAIYAGAVPAEVFLAHNVEVTGDAPRRTTTEGDTE